MKTAEFIEFLDSRNYSYDKAIFEKPGKKKFKLVVSDNNSKYLAEFIPEDSIADKTGIVNEILIANQFKEANLPFSTPRMIDCSIEDLWYIREYPKGRPAGNVYNFSDSFISSANSIPAIISFFDHFALADIAIRNDLKSEEMTSRITDQLVRFKITNKKILQYADRVLEEIPTLSFDETNNLHGDLQPTNIICGDDIYFIDFESSKEGDILYDFASIFHRLELNKPAQQNLLDEFTGLLSKRDIKFNKERFNIYHRYYLLIDCMSLSAGSRASFNDTILSSVEQRELLQTFLELLSKS
jgi:hypothetical protein